MVRSPVPDSMSEWTHMHMWVHASKASRRGHYIPGAGVQRHWAVSGCWGPDLHLQEAQDTMRPSGPSFQHPPQVSMAFLQLLASYRKELSTAQLSTSLSPWGTRRRGRVEVMSLLTCGLVAKQRSSKSKCRVYLEARAKHTINPLLQTSCSVPQITFNDILHWLVD